MNDINTFIVNFHLYIIITWSALVYFDFLWQMNYLKSLHVDSWGNGIQVW